MSYDPPLEIKMETIAKSVGRKIDGWVYDEVRRLGIDVNIEELAKALAYDRDQYWKGFQDGRFYTPPNPTNADLIRSADTEIGMVDIILKLVKKIPEGEDKRRTLYQLLMKEAEE